MATNAHPLLPFQEILSEIKHLVATKSTGTVFITSQDNHAVQIGLDSGNVIGCRFRFKRGNDALPLIAAMEAGRYSFANASYSGEDASLPPTTDMLLQELALCLGPIASILIDDYLQDEGAVDSPKELQKMILTLADEIDDPKRRDEFLQRVQSKL